MVIIPQNFTIVKTFFHFCLQTFAFRRFAHLRIHFLFKNTKEGSPVTGSLPIGACYGLERLVSNLDHNCCAYNCQNAQDSEYQETCVAGNGGVGLLGLIGLFGLYGSVGINCLNSHCV